MRPSHCIAGLAAGAVAVFSLGLWLTPGVQAAGGSAGGSTLCDLIPNNPLVTMEVAGFTLSGTLVYERLNVNEDGSASYVAGGGPAIPAAGTIQIQHVPPTAIAALQQGLRDARAMALCDLPEIVSDTPLTTITVFAGDADAQAHTFSYFSTFGSNNHNEVDVLLRSFITIWFPNNTVGG